VRLLDRRIGFLFGLFLLALLAIGMRAWWLDTVQAHSLRSRALSQQIESLTLPAKRGTIYDRQGKVLAISEDSSPTRC
jgi:cell division protein FtsI/penicillin-binding protein 2